MAPEPMLSEQAVARLSRQPGAHSAHQRRTSAIPSTTYWRPAPAASPPTRFLRCFAPRPRQPLFPRPRSSYTLHRNGRQPGPRSLEEKLPKPSTPHRNLQRRRLVRLQLSEQRLPHRSNSGASSRIEPVPEPQVETKLHVTEVGPFPRPISASTS